MANTITLVRASSFITLDAAGEAVNAETVVIGGKTYTFLGTVGTNDGSIHIGAAVADTVDNLVAAINLDPSEGETGTDGTDYGSSMVRNPEVYATRVAATGVITLRAHIPGVQGNLTTVAAGTSAITIDNAVLENGAGNVADWFDSLFALTEMGGEIHEELRRFSVVAGGKLD